MGFFDILLAVMAATSLALIVRNMSAQGLPNLRPARKDCATDAIIVSGHTLRPLIYIAGLPTTPPDRHLGARIAAAVRHSGLNATLAHTLLRADKPALMKRLERDIERVRLAFEATKNPKYAERLRFLEKLYSDIARTTRPYTGSTILVVWIDEKTSEEEAKALKTLIEAETGLEFKRYNGSLAEALATTATPASNSTISLAVPWVESAGPEAIAIGYSPDYNALVTLSWPEDFETHIGIIGPTGRGKTVLMLGIILQLYMQPPTTRPSIVVLDPKGDVERMLTKARIEPVKPENPENAIHEACRGARLILYSKPDPEEGRKLVRELLECYIRERPSHRTVLFIDEAWKYMDIASRYLEETIRQGRSLGLHIVYATQSFTDVGPEIVENTGVLLVFGADSKEYTQHAEKIGVPGKELLFLPVGVAFARKRGKTPIMVRIYNFESYLK